MKRTAEKEKKSYRPSEFAAAYGVSVSTTYDLIRSGALAAKLLDPNAGRPRYLIPAAAATAWFDDLVDA